MFEDKYNFTQDQNRRFAKMNLTRLVFTNSRFEGVNTTLPQTQTIIDGLGVDGVPIDDINVIEFSARMGGGSKYKLIKYMSGVDIMKVWYVKQQ